MCCTGPDDELRGPDDELRCPDDVRRPDDLRLDVRRPDELRCPDDVRRFVRHVVRRDVRPAGELLVRGLGFWDFGVYSRLRLGRYHPAVA